MPCGEPEKSNFVLSNVKSSSSKSCKFKGFTDRIFFNAGISSDITKSAIFISHWPIPLMGLVSSLHTSFVPSFEKWGCSAPCKSFTWVSCQNLLPLESITHILLFMPTPGLPTYFTNCESPFGFSRCGFSDWKIIYSPLGAPLGWNSGFPLFIWGTSSLLQVRHLSFVPSSFMIKISV